MSEEIEITEAPKWVKELEARREHRLKARLGHEAGAGAPCRTCNEQCPGLDLHFWRKICKNCKCSKEDHDVHDDDIYGWAQHELLGSKPNKIKSKIVLPGKKDEVELEWTPKGQKDTVDKFLKTLPPEQLPVKGSQAAQDRKQMLQKQIPIHDIDPTLCHDLTESELKQMNDYIAHMKQNSVGVGKVIQIGTQHGSLHTIGSKDGMLLMERYPKEIPSSELVKLQGQSAANALNKKLAIMGLDNKNFDRQPGQNYMPNPSAYTENVSPHAVGGIRDIRAPIYCEDSQGCRLIRPEEQVVDPTNPSRIRDVNYPISGSNLRVQRQAYDTDNVEVFDPSTLLPQNLPNIGMHPSEIHQKPYNPNMKTHNYPYYEQDPGSLESDRHVSGDFTQGSPRLQRNIPNYSPNALNILETSQNPRNQGLKTEMYPQYVTQENAINAINANQMVQPTDSEQTLGNIARTDKSLPHFAPGKYNTYGDTQNPVKIGNLKDLAFSTYDPEKLGSNDDIQQFNDANRNKLNPQFEGTIPNQYYDDQSPMRMILRQKYGDFNQNKLPEGELGSYDQYGEPYHHGQQGGAYDKFGKPIEPTPGSKFGQLMNPEDGFVGFDKYGEPLPYSQNVRPQEAVDKFGRPLDASIRRPEEGNYGDVPSYNQNMPGTETVSSLGPRANKPLPHLNPTSLHMTENKRDPLQVNVGSINDIVYQMPEIKSAASEENPLHQRYRVPEPFATISNAENLPSCHRCKQSFTPNEFAIQIEQNNALFHPGCLKCAGCNQILADMFYFYDNKSNEVYCLRDYAKIRGIPRCQACDELIFVKEYTLAENNTFHIKHFCCFECDEPLAGKNYIMEDSQPVCLPCYEKLKANRCRTCTNIIKPDEQGANLKGVHFHATDACFACNVCRKPLLGAKLMFKNETLYCSPDCYMADQ